MEGIERIVCDILQSDRGRRLLTVKEGREASFSSLMRRNQKGKKKEAEKVGVSRWEFGGN